MGQQCCVGDPPSNTTVTASSLPPLPTPGNVSPVVTGPSAPQSAERHVELFLTVNGASIAPSSFLGVGAAAESSQWSTAQHSEAGTFRTASLANRVGSPPDESELAEERTSVEGLEISDVADC